ncbi:hypothetical protein TNCV_62271 [Trichonephila clavipes]|nr:hypothetical protein TNCV_62271 [Trichonephila clavipes]
MIRAHYEQLLELKRSRIIGLKEVGWANRGIARHIDLNCLQENRLKVNLEREQDSPVEMGASNISRFKEMPFLKAKRQRAHSVVSGVRVKTLRVPRLASQFNSVRLRPPSPTYLSLSTLEIKNILIIRNRKEYNFPTSSAILESLTPVI